MDRTRIEHVPALVASRRPARPSTPCPACRAVIGIDTGLTHIAVQQGTPTVHDLPAAARCTCDRGPTARRCGAATAPTNVLAVEAAYAYNQTVSLRDFRPRPRRLPVGVAVPGPRPGPRTPSALLRELL